MFVVTAPSMQTTCIRVRCMQVRCIRCMRIRTRSSFISVDWVHIHFLWRLPSPCSKNTDIWKTSILHHCLEKVILYWDSCASIYGQGRSFSLVHQIDAYFGCSYNTMNFQGDHDREPKKRTFMVDIEVWSSWPRKLTIRQVWLLIALNNQRE